jgi:di/tricarboxylate transporter
MVLSMAATLAMPAPVVAVIMSPIALNAAINLGISPYAFLLGIAYGIAASFLSPVAIPVNTLIISPGGYRYSDFIKHGLPMSLIVLAVSVALLPVIFPF